MSFRALYAASVLHFEQARGQSSPIFFPVGSIVDRLKRGDNDLTGVTFTGVECRAGDPSGHIEYYPKTGVARVYYDKSFNECHKRYVWAKELMHLFDSEDAKTSDEAGFRTLLDEIENRPIQSSEAYKAENMAKWMALLVLCPLPERNKVVERVAKGESEYSVALDYKIPEAYVKNLVSKYYQDAYDLLIVE